MGTNFYFMTKNKELVNKYFPNESNQHCYDCGYEIVDNPYLGYEIHLCKRSAGWRPLFQRHRQAFNTFKELEKFYYDHEQDLEVYDEYENQYEFIQFKEEMLKHAARKPVPMKWVYEISEFTKYFYDNFHDRELKPTLETKECSPEEAELWIPFNHTEYAQTKEKARKRYKMPLPYWVSSSFDSREKYWDDPDYNFDWVLGDFS